MDIQALVTISPIHHEDLKELTELESSVFTKDAFSYERFESYLDADFLGPEYVSKTIFLALKVDSEMAAYILIEPSECTSSLAEFTSIATKEKFTNQNYAKKLWEEAQKILPSLGYRKIFLYVRPSNTIAVDWYKRLGFVVTDTVRDYYWDEDGIKMVLDLPQPSSVPML